MSDYSYLSPVYRRWMERTNGEEAMNDEERLEACWDRALYKNSFPGSEVEWIMRQLGYGKDE